MSLQSEVGFIHDAILRELERFPAAALITPEGEALAMHYQTLPDIGTLAAAAMTCHKYFQLKAGDVIIMNDPYSGGSTLASVTLVMGVAPQAIVAGAAAEALLAVRVPFKPRVQLSQTVDQEGVRIPPSPLCFGGQLNLDLLKAIAGHPLAPSGIAESLPRVIDDMTDVARLLTRFRRLVMVTWNKKFLRDWLDVAQKQAEHALSDLAEGDTRGELAISPSCRLNVRLEIKNHRVLFDFSGSGAPDAWAMSDAATLGTCVGALISCLPVAVPVTDGLFRAVDVVAPMGSLVHARFPAPVFLGFTEGAQIIANFLVKLFGQVDKKLAAPVPGIGQCAFEIDFGGGKHYYDDVDPGAAALRDRHGAAALNVWRRSHLHRSIEASERLYPVRIGATAVRRQSGGSGQWQGGDGMTKVIEVLAPAVLRWNTTRSALKAEGSQGGKAAIQAEIQCVRRDGKHETLEARGEIQVAAGDQIIVHSSGGGGFGAPV